MSRCKKKGALTYHPKSVHCRPADFCSVVDLHIRWHFFVCIFSRVNKNAILFLTSTSLNSTQPPGLRTRLSSAKHWKGRKKKEEMSIYLNMDVKKVKTISLHCSIHLSSELRQVAADGCNQNSCPGTAISRWYLLPENGSWMVLWLQETGARYLCRGTLIKGTCAPFLTSTSQVLCCYFIVKWGDDK